MADVKKVYTEEEVRKIAPSYRGKIENFKFDKVSQNRKPRPAKQRVGPKSDKPHEGSHFRVEQKPTPQRNDSIISESIFGVDTHVVEIEPIQMFRVNHAKLPDIALETFSNYANDVKQLDRVMVRQEMVYYATALLWLRLIEIKLKQDRTTLTSAEKDMRKGVMDKVFNVPRPIFAYLSQVGNVTDKMGKETRLEDCTLPETVIQGLGGYHASTVNETSHLLYEELPCLGIAGDNVMALASQNDMPTADIKLPLPANAMWTENLLCNTAIGIRRSEIKQRLQGIGISTTAFPEYVKGTRFSLKYMVMLSDIIGNFTTYRNEKVVIHNMLISGGESQVIMTRPIENEDDDKNIRVATVQATSASCSTTAEMGAAYVFGFQLFKEPGEGTNDTQRSQRWCCVTSQTEAEEQWSIPATWMANRNQRRNVPPGVGTERFRGLGKRQDVALMDTIRRMIETSR